MLIKNHLLSESTRHHELSQSTCQAISEEILSWSEKFTPKSCRSLRYIEPGGLINPSGLSGTSDFTLEFSHFFILALYIFSPSYMQ